jgi:hypothetical protein
MGKPEGNRSLEKPTHTREKIVKWSVKKGGRGAGRD